MKKIILIIAYFGKFRNDNGFWLKSIEKNPTVDFLIITDQNIIVPTNVQIIHSSFEKFVNKIKQHFDFKINIPQPYKLCDFKVAYGDILREYIKDYDFWGHCDNDLIFGDIRKFITNDILEKYERILIRGHFTLYKNCDSVNLLYRKASPFYKEVFSSNKNYCFDEYPGTGMYWVNNRNEQLYNKIIFDDINYLKYNFITVHKKELDKNRSNFIYSFENGKLFRVFIENSMVKKRGNHVCTFSKKEITSSNLSK